VRPALPRTRKRSERQPTECPFARRAAVMSEDSSVAARSNRRARGGRKVRPALRYCDEASWSTTRHRASQRLVLVDMGMSAASGGGASRA
jgi:hypothetical protein